jgi:DNA (cytosine-5)-methyltransferase 1
MPEGKLRFFDACSGIGCFHIGMVKAGYECVGASELDFGLQQRYPEAFNLNEDRMFGSVHNLIDSKKWKESLDDMRGAILTAGFPCQPFSKSGSQMGKNHEEGTVFESLVEILESLQSPAFIFENVPNLLGNNHKETWEEMQDILKKSYQVDFRKISTKEIGIPQNRNRVFIVGIRTDEELEFFSNFEDFFEKIEYKSLDYYLESDKSWVWQKLSTSHIESLCFWNDFLAWIDENPDLISNLPKPLWAMESYYQYNIEKLQKLISKRSALSRSELISCLSSEQKKKSSGMILEDIILNFFPPYYRKIILGIGSDYTSRAIFAQNSRNYMIILEEWVRENKGNLAWESWVERLKELEISNQKLEWHLGRNLPDKIHKNAKNEDSILASRFRNCLIQFRSSGIRVSRNDVFPTLVAIGQVPYMKRGTSLKRPPWQVLARLQSIPDDFIVSNKKLFGTGNEPIKRLGNAVNCKLVEGIAERLKNRF